MKNRLITHVILGLLIFSLASCSDVLDVGPKGVITEDMLDNPESVDGLVTAAYAFMPNGHAFNTYNPWIASFRSDDAYKGGGGLDDQTPWYQMELFSTVTSNVGNNDGAWYHGFQALSRVNTALNVINGFDEDDLPLKTERIAEMRFLRGWIYFHMKRRWKWVPYFQEDATPEDIQGISNRPDGMTDLELWQHIYDDLKFAADNLPPVQEEVGRANQYIAEAFVVQTLLWMAYEQDDDHQVTQINTERLSQALSYIESIESGGFELAEDIAVNFLMEYDNASPESIWELQFTSDDGTPDGKENFGNGLTAPWWNPHFSCCDFHKPTYNMVNAFKVDDNGLPLFDTFNDEDLTDKDSYFSNNSWDPRIGHTVAVPGLPWKYEEILFDSSGSRQPQVYGYFHSLRENVKTDEPNNRGWSFNSMNQIEVRYAEVLLWKAEILIELGRHNEALPLINEIRQRASNSTDRLRFPDGSYTLDYNIEPYVDGVNINWSQENARLALRWERRLEFAMEGRRFYDLVRWGIAEEVMNDYFAKESQRRSWLGDGQFTSGRDEYMPIPQAQMNWSQGVYKQNPGY